MYHFWNRGPVIEVQVAEYIIVVVDRYAGFNMLEVFCRYSRFSCRPIDEVLLSNNILQFVVISMKIIVG